MSRARLFLSGIRAEGKHGARTGEKDTLQPFVVDLDLEVEVGEDRIEDTTDYREIVATVRDVVERDSFDLIESMAEAIAVRVASFGHVTSATAVVHKPHAAGRLEIDGVAAAATVIGDG